MKTTDDQHQVCARAKVRRLFTTYNVEALRELASTLTSHPYHRQLLDGTVPWDQSETDLDHMRDHMADAWQMRDLGITSRYRPLKERLAELAAFPVEVMTCADIEVVVEGPHARVHAVFPMLNPNVGDALLNLGFIQPGRHILEVLDWRAEHGMDVLLCSIFGDVRHEGRVTRGFQNAYLLRSPRLEPLLDGDHPSHERARRINDIVASCHQYRTLRQTRTAARRLEAAIEDHRRLRRVEVILGLPAPPSIPPEELDEAELEALAAFVPSGSVASGRDGPDTSWPRPSWTCRDGNLPVDDRVHGRNATVRSSSPVWLIVPHRTA